MKMKLFLVLVIFVYSTHAAVISSNLEPLTDEVVNAINAMNLTWKAAKNFYGPIDMNKLVATQRDNFDHAFPFVELTNKTLIPTSFDARSEWNNCPSIGKIYDQKKGYPAWIFASVGQIADRLCITYGVQIDVEATVDRMMKEHGGFNNKYNSPKFVEAFKYWSKKGIFTIKTTKSEDCPPFESPTIKCYTKEISLDKYYKVDVVMPKSNTDRMIDIMHNGPITINMQVYSDFPSYKSGVYVRKSGKFLGAQIVKIIGWGYSNDSHHWIATNSWGKEWGNKGTFAIELGTSQFGNLWTIAAASLKSVDHIYSIPKSYAQDQLFVLA